MTQPPSPAESRLLHQQDRDNVYEVTGASVPPPVDWPAHPLLRRNNLPQWERLLATVQDASQLLAQTSESSESSNMVGRLTAMCSLDEVVEKQQTCTANDLERLNVPEDTDLRIVNKLLAVKSFQRSDASKVFLQADTRPVLWCRRTVNHILNLQLEADTSEMPWLYRRLEDYRFLDVYNFVRDRLRGVWTDLTVQHCLCHRGTIETLEISFRFLLLAEELVSLFRCILGFLQLCDEPDFNAVQNGRLMSTCLEKLMASYSAVRQFMGSAEMQQIESGVNLVSWMKHLSKSEQKSFVKLLVHESPYEPEFWSYRILLCLSHGPRSAAGSAEAVRHRIPKNLLDQPRICAAFAAVDAFAQSNAYRYFRILQQADYLTGVLLCKFSNIVRLSLLRLFCGGAAKQSPAIPFQLFLRLFNFSEEAPEHIANFCTSNELEIVPAAKGSTSSSPAAVKFGPFCPDLSDLQPSRVRARRFQSDQMKRVFQKAGVSRKALLDPTLGEDPSLRLPRKPLLTAPTPSFQPSSWQPPPLTARASEKALNIPSTSPLPSQQSLFALASMASAKLELSPPVHSNQQTSLSPTIVPDGCATRERLTRPFGKTTAVTPEAKRRSTETENSPPSDGFRIPHFGSSETASEPESTIKPLATPTVTTQQPSAAVTTHRGKRKADEAISGDVEQGGGMFIRRNSSIPNIDNNRIITTARKTRRQHVEGGSSAEQPPPIASDSGSPTKVPMFSAVALGAVPAASLLSETNLKSQMQEKLDEYRQRIGRELLTSPFLSGYDALPSFTEALRKEEEPNKLAIQVDNIPVPDIVKKLVPTSSSAMANLVNAEYVSWHLCFTDPGSSSSSALQAVLDGIMFGFEVTDASHQTSRNEGLLHEWSSGKLCAAETTLNGHSSTWIRSRRTSGHVVVRVECVKVTHLLQSLRQSQHSSILFWNFRNVVSLRGGASGGNRKFKLEPGTGTLLSQELDLLERILSVKSSSGASDHFGPSLFNIVFLVHLELVVPAKCDAVKPNPHPSIMLLQNALASQLAKKTGFLTKMDSGLSQKLASLCRKRISASAGSVALTPGLTQFYKKIVERFEAFERPFVYAMAVSGAKSSNVDVSNKQPNTDPTSSQDSTWTLVPQALSRILTHATDEARSGLLELFQSIDQNALGDAKGFLTRQILRYPIRISWTRKTSETLPFVLITMWKRAVARLDLKDATLETLTSALKDGVSDFHKSILWDVCAPPSRRKMANISDDESDSGGDEDKELGLVTLKNSLVIRKMLRRVEKALGIVLSSPDIMSKLASDVAPDGTTSTSAIADLIFAARRLVRQVIRHTLELLVWRHQSGVLLGAKLRIPQPLYLCTELPPWEDRTLPPQFFTPEMTKVSPTAKAEPATPPSATPSSQQQQFEHHQQNKQVVAPTSDIFEVLRKRIQHAADFVLKEIESDRAVVTNLQRQVDIKP